MNEFLHSVYGSRLYGTSTPTSDTDNKVIYIPELDDLLLGKKPRITKTRVDADGNKVPDDASMPDGGVETEYIPLQQFVYDFVHGQTYAVEVAWAYVSNREGRALNPIYLALPDEFIWELVNQFGNSDVYSMVSFAMKQTLDYVNRGDRLNDARKVLEALRDKADRWKEPYVLRLDTMWNGLANEQVLDVLARETDLKIGSSTNNNKTMRTLELNGRSYLETTTLEHLITLVKKKVSEYGERTNKAAETDVDFKSLSHAVRVYQQAIELLDTGKMTFPRPNVEFLLEIKQGRGDLEAVKQLLRDLDAEVKAKMETSTVRKRTPQLEEASQRWLLEWLRTFYALDGS